MSERNWQTIAVLPAVYRERCLARLLWGKPEPIHVETLLVEWHDVRIWFADHAVTSATTIEVCDPDLENLTKILLMVLALAVRSSADQWVIDWTTSSARWGKPQRLRRRLIDDIDELSSERICGHMSLRGGRMRPYKGRALDVNRENIGTFIAHQYGHVVVEMTRSDDRLVFHLDNASPGALAGLWKQVMQRLGVRVPNGQRKRGRKTRRKKSA